MKNKWLRTLIILLVIYIGLGTLDAMGVFVMGTYYEYEDGELNTESSGPELKFYGELGGEDGEMGMSYQIHGENFDVYWGDANVMNGEIVNGVMKVTSFMGKDTYYCKEGKTPEDFEKKGFVDYFRLALSPVAKIMGNIIY